MTLSTEDNSRVYSGNGVTTLYPFPIKFPTDTDLVVIVDGVTKSNGVHYNVAGAGLDVGGSVTFTAGNIPPVGVGNVSIERILPLTQNADPQNFDGNPADSTEAVYDTIVMMVQQVWDSVKRSPKLPVGSTTEITLPEPSEGEFMVWSGSDLINGGDASDIAGAQASASTATAQAVIATDQAAIAVAAAASVNLPDITGNALSYIRANAGETSQEYRTPTEVKADLGLGALAVLASVGTSEIDSGAATSGQVLTADGAGGVSYATPTGVLSEEYESAEQTITSAGTVTVTHTLTQEPKQIDVWAVCKTAEHGFPVGAKIPMGEGARAWSSNRGFVVYITNTTQINVTFGNGALALSELNTSGANVAFTNANWKIIIKAFA